MVKKFARVWNEWNQNDPESRTDEPGKSGSRHSQGMFIEY